MTATIEQTLLEIRIKVQKEQAEAAIKAIENALKGLNEKVKETTRKFDMNALSFLFTGMAMQRMAQSFFTFAFNKWEQYEGYQGAAIDSTMRLSAAWEFMRFSIFNALGQSELFQNLITALIDAFNWISQFVSKHPEFTAFIAEFIILVGILGGIAQVGSLIYQFWFITDLTKTWFALKFAGSLLDKGLGLISLALWGTVGGKGALVQKIQAAIKYLKELFLLSISGTFLEAALIALSGYFATMIKKLTEIYRLLKTIGLIGAIGAAVAAAPATAAAIGTTAAAYGSYEVSKMLKESELKGIEKTQGVSREEAIEIMSRNTEQIMQQGVLKVQITNPEIINRDVVNMGTTSSVFG